MAMTRCYGKVLSKSPEQENTYLWVNLIFRIKMTSDNDHQTIITRRVMEGTRHLNMNKQKYSLRESPIVVQKKRIQLGTMRLWVRSLALLSGLRSHRCCELWWSLQMWLRSGIAEASVALMGPLALEFPYAAGTALKDKKKKYSL